MIFTNHSMMTSILRTIEKSPHEMGGCEFDNLISKEKLEEDDDFKDFIDCFVVTQLKKSKKSRAHISIF